MAEAVPGVVIFCSLVLAFAQWENFLERNTFYIRAISILRKWASLWRHRSPPQPGPRPPPPLCELLKGRFSKISHFLREPSHIWWSVLSPGASKYCLCDQTLLQRTSD